MEKRIGYKATYNFQCKDLTYEIGKTYEINNIDICDYGFHYCPKIEAVLKYYNINKDLKILEIEDIGDKRVECEDKICTNKIKIIREVPIEEHKLFKVDKNSNIIYYKDFNGYKKWYKYDENNNLIYYKDFNKYEVWKKYDENNNLIYFKNSNGIEEWKKYDENNNLIYFKNSNGIEEWKKYDEKGNLISYKDNNGKNWEITIK